MPRGISRYDEARQQRVLLTPSALAQRLRAKLWFWYSADFLTIDNNGLVFGALDLTGGERNASQATPANRLDYFPSDLMFGGRPAFGATSNTGLRFLASPATVIVFQYFVSAYYKDGVDNTFDAVSYLIGGAGPFGSFQLRGESNAANWRALTTTRTFYNTGDPFPRKNGFDPSQTVLPLPASVIESRAALGRSNQTRIGGAESNATWNGGFRHVVACNQILSDYETALLEGVIAWDDGSQERLSPTHFFVNRPPMISD